jgi:zinc/manganese transport system permease protein
MLNAWTVGSIVAVVAGLVGFFIVMRGSAFVAHAVPNGSFAGAAAASLIGINTLIGLGVFSLLGALGIGALSRRGRHDVATALALVVMLGLGALFLSLNTEYSPEIYSLLFGEILGISNTELGPTAALAVLCVAVVVVLYRPLMLSSVLPEAGEARGVSAFRIELCFLAVVALATTMTVPVVGTLLIFSLMIGSPAAARSFTDRPSHAIVLSVVIALAAVWSAIALAYTTNLPVGFFVAAVRALAYARRGAEAAAPGSAPLPLKSPPPGPRLRLDEYHQPRRRMG